MLQYAFNALEEKLDETNLHYVAHSCRVIIILLFLTWVI